MSTIARAPHPLSARVRAELERMILDGTLSPGERLNEILFARDEPMAETGLDGVMAAKPIFAGRERMLAWLQELARAVAAQDRRGAEAVLDAAIPDFRLRQPAMPPAAPAQLSSQSAAASQR